MPVAVTDVDGVVVFPPNEIDDLEASAGLLIVDGVVLPVTLPNEKVVFGGTVLGDEVGVVENGLLVPDPAPLFSNAPNAGFGAVSASAPLSEFVAPNDPPVDALGIFNLNLGGPFDSAGTDVTAEGLNALKSNVDGAFNGSGFAVELEAPTAGLGAVVLVNPKLNLGGAGVAAADPITAFPFWGVLEEPADFVDPLAMFEGLKTNEAFADSLTVFGELNPDVGLAGSAPWAFVFPNAKGELLVAVVLGAPNTCVAGCALANPPRRPNKDPPLSEF